MGDGELREHAAFFHRDDGEETSREGEGKRANRERLYQRRSKEGARSRSPGEQHHTPRNRQGSRALVNETAWRKQDEYCSSSSEPPAAQGPAFQGWERPGNESASCITWSTGCHGKREKDRPGISASGEKHNLLNHGIRNLGEWRFHHIALLGQETKDQGL